MPAPDSSSKAMALNTFSFTVIPCKICSNLFLSERRLTDNQLKKEHKRTLRISKVILANKQFISKARYMEKGHKIMAVSQKSCIYRTLLGNQFIKSRIFREVRTIIWRRRTK